jgi:hypothetical protein
MNRLADEEQASKDAAMLAARDGDELLVGVDVAWDAISGTSNDDIGGRR